MKIRVVPPVVMALSLLACSCFGQQSDSIAKAEEYYKMGMEIFDFTHRKQAAELFVLATQMNSKNAKAQFMAGKSIMLTIRKEQSLGYFRKAWNLDPKVDEDILYYLGQAYHYSEKFDSAIQFYDRYNRVLSRSLRFERSVKVNEVNRKIFECRNAMIYMAYPTDVTISHLDKNINSEYPDYAPSINADETIIVFTTRRPEDNSNEKIAPDHEYYEEIYSSEKVNGNWTPAKNIGIPLNNNFHNANVTISPDGKEMVLYHDTYGGDLFTSRKLASGTWTNPEPIKGINTEYLENSASISKDGQQLFFTSNRPGGYGGTDIYVSSLDKRGNWSPAVNIGPDINTELDEDGVFIAASGKHLYFSSNGHAGMGDLDLYRSTYDSDKKTWGDPLNLGYPINSVENDIYFVLNADEHYAYISSVRRDNIGEQDIYKVDMQNWKPVDLGQPAFLDAFTVSEAKKEPVVFNTKIDIVVVDEATNQLLDASAYLRKKNKDTVKLASLSKGRFETAINMGHASQDTYVLEVGADGFVPYSATVYFMGGQTKNLIIEDTIRLRAPIINVSVPLNVYFSTNSDVVIGIEEIRSVLRILSEASPSMKIEINGHTDDTGEAAYNIDLSQRRANAVKTYLIRSGVESQRIIATGFGEEQPIATNATAEGRRLNRRTELKVVPPKK